MNQTLEKVRAFGLHLNPEDFAGLMEPEMLRTMVLSACSTYWNIYKVDQSGLANTIIAAAYQAKETFCPGKKSFRSHLNDHFRWAVLNGLKNHTLVNTAPVHIPRHKSKERPQVVSLDAPISDDEPHKQTFLDRVVTDSLDGASRMEAFEKLCELRSDVSEMLGILRVIPYNIHTRARDIDVFEIVNGLNGRTMDGAYHREAIGKIWDIHPTTVDLIVNRVWQRLIIAHSPIISKLELHNVLAKIEMLEEAVNESAIIRPMIPTGARKDEILSHFKADLAKARLQRRDRKSSKEFQLDFNGVGFEKAATKKETMAMIVRKAFDLSELELCAKKECSDRVSKARYLIAYLLMTDLCATKYEAARFIGRKADMVMYGVRFIKARIQAQDIHVIGALAAIRREYRFLFP